MTNSTRKSRASRVSCSSNIGKKSHEHVDGGTAAILQARIRRRAARVAAGHRIAGYDLDDLTQEVWVALLSDNARRLRLWNPKRGLFLEGFVALVADRVFTTIARRASAKRRHAPVINFDCDAAAMCGPNQTPEDLAIVGEAVRHWTPVIAENLPARGRQIFTMLYLHCLSPEDAANKLGTNTQVIYNWSRKIRNMIRSYQ